jgi:hypothetical protein
VPLALTVGIGSLVLVIAFAVHIVRLSPDG